MHQNSPMGSARGQDKSEDTFSQPKRHRPNGGSKTHLAAAKLTNRSPPVRPAIPGGSKPEPAVSV